MLCLYQQSVKSTFLSNSNGSSNVFTQQSGCCVVLCTHCSEIHICNGMTLQLVPECFCPNILHNNNPME